ncbi:T6SS immunity protein Tdi1 domain-containing protein [Ruminococcus albus]|uniref:T6SS immunity protein Tdi1 domain-containing protein n=1 Tax=Ruminococcus albus TaxID=1264 RepID=UPI0004674166|nr:T6SS immunity protein Tdi1 domain-containing protein [Ruminococcus albus]
MFEKILGTSEKVGATSCADKEELLEIAAGNSFLDGLFTFFRKEDVKKWQKIFREVFPALKEELAFFGYDWLGRLYFVDSATDNVKMVDAFDCEFYATDMPFESFLDDIVDDPDGFLAAEFYEEWVDENGDPDLKYGSCIGYKVPLFLNGAENIDNLDVTDLEVYWTITGDLYN